MDGIIQNLDIILSGASVIALLGLLFIYSRNYRDFKTRFSLGLFLFISLFLIEETVYTISLLLNTRIATDLQTFVDLLELIAFLILLIVARK